LQKKDGMKTTLRKLQIIAVSATIAFSFSACEKKASTDAANTQPKNVGAPTTNKTENAEKKGPPGKGGGGRRDAGPVAVRVETAKKALAPLAWAYLIAVPEGTSLIR
jgi:hypothetical protein